MATHSNILAWRIPGTGEPGGLPSMGHTESDTTEVTPQMAAHQAPRSLGFSRQEHWSGLPFPSPMHENEK